MATFNSARDVVVNSALVVHEVRVDSEGSLHGSVGVDLRLNLVWGGGLGDGSLLALILGVLLA